MNALPAVRVSNRGAARLRGGHVWVYRSDLVSADRIPPGALVQVVDPKGKPLGTALYSSSSQIAIRLVSTRAVEDLATLIRERIRNAIAYRKMVVRHTDAYRLIFSEGDFLPGLIVDRYNDVLSLQILTQAMDSEPARQAALAELQDQLRPGGIIERVDARVRELEQLPTREPGLIAGEKSSTTFTMNGIKFHYAGLEGQK